MTKTSSRKARAEKLAQRLKMEIAKPRTWRDVAHDFPPSVKAGTLNRIANTNGAWLPKKKEILDALGLIPHTEVQPDWVVHIRKKIALMAKRTRQDLGLE